MGAIGSCCCTECPLPECPWETATVTILGMTFSVNFPAPTADCCQREVSICQMIGPTFVRDCFDTQFDWQLINPFDYLSTTGPFCDWPTVIQPGTAVDGCCGSTNYRVEWRGRIRQRFWFWVQARVRFIICYCLTPEGEPGYRMRIEMEFSRASISNTTRLIKYRNRKYTRVCCPPPGDGGGGGYPCEPGCFSDPPEPGWTDNSGDDIPVAPPLSHGRLQMVPCPEFVPENRPVFDPICTGTCDEENDLIPGCYDSGPYRIISDCELVDVVTCLGTIQIRMPSRWQVVGETPRITSNSGTLVWESGILGLTPACVKDEGENVMVIPVSRAAATWSVVGAPCYDEYGVDQGPYEITIPQVVNVTVTRSCGTP